MNRWPNFFIVGAPKAGTTSLHSYLNEIPEVFMSQIKEPNYFSPIVSKQNNLTRINNEKKYQDLFKNVKNQICIGEASPSYLRDPQTPQLIHEKIPNAKIIIMLRDPVERSFSHNLHRVRRGINNSFNLSLKKYIETKDIQSEFFRLMVYPSLYYKQVKIYQETFGLENVKIIIFEEFIQNTTQSVKEVLEFLGVKSEVPTNINKTYNPYLEPKNKFAFPIIESTPIKKILTTLLPQRIRGSVREKFFTKTGTKPKLDKETREKLIELYNPEVQKLKTLLGRDLPWKNF